MGLISDRDILRLIRENKLVIEPFTADAIGPTSIDLRLGTTLIQYTPQTIQLGESVPLYKEFEITHSGYLLPPNDFVLGMTFEKVTIPNGYQGFIETKGDIARAGIQIHNNDGHIDPGTKGHITLEISNLNRDGVVINIIPGIFICQLFIFKLSSPSDKPYHGKYSNQTKPTTYLP